MSASPIFILLKPILFPSSWFIKQEFVNTSVPKLSSMLSLYNYHLKKRERFRICSKITISQYFFYGIFSLVCSTKWSMLSVTRDCTTHLSGNILEWQCSTNCPAKANCTVLTKDVLQPSVQTTLKCWGET